jgi:hypothetical protein
MANENYPIEEIKDLVNQLVNITEILIDPPESIDEEVIDKLRGSQYETVQCIKALTEEH